LKKTQAMRALDAQGVAYRALEYDTSGGFHSGEEAAALVGAPPETVYKTLVVLRENDHRARPLLVMLPVAEHLDLKALAQGLGEKKLRMASQKEAERITGMQVGGISALGIQRRERFEVLIDEQAQRLERVHVSAGVRGTDLELAVDDLVGVTGALFVRTR
jgi:Cys-tRNA(Pro)/Cys-tRNA(Cys) deacylase